jgi:hypothetical protein
MTVFFAVYDTVDKEVVLIADTFIETRSVYRPVYGIKVPDRWYAYRLGTDIDILIGSPITTTEVPEAVRLAHMLLT